MSGGPAGRPRDRGARVFLTVALILTAGVDAGPARAADPVPAVVLFDEAHGQRFRASGSGPLDLSALSALFTSRGGAVRQSATPLTPETLGRARVLIISGPFQPLSPAEIEAVVAWVGRGGALGVMIHIEPPVGPLLHRFGVSVSNGVIREKEGILGGEPLNFRVTRLKAHPLTRGLSGFAVYGAWALLPTMSDVEAVAETSPAAWVDLNRNQKLDEGDVRQAFAVLVAGKRGAGRLAVFGDDALFQNQFLKGDNRRLAENLASWLLGDGARPPGRPKRPDVVALSGEAAQ